MGEALNVTDTRPLFKGLVSDWLQRLRDAEPFITSIPREGLLPEEASKVADLYEKVNPLSRNPNAYEEPNREFYESYRSYADKIRPELRRVLPSIQERFIDFNKNTGIEDYTPVSAYTLKPGDLMTAARHEIYAHELPYKLGFMPDYRGFDTGRTMEDQRLVFGPNSVTPINEMVAVTGENALTRLARGKEPSANWLGSAFQPVFTEQLRKEALQGLQPNSPEGELVNTRFDLAYPTEYLDKEGRPLTFPVKEDASTVRDLNEISKLFLEKYIRPASQQYEGALRTQFPVNNTSFEGLEYSVPRFSRVLSTLDQKYAGPTRPSLFLPHSFFLGSDPVGAAVAGAKELASGIRRTPSSLFPGAADLIPSEEAIRTGYRKGLPAMGAQMGREFVQSLPTSAAAAAVLATPAAAPFAPGIGAGLVGVNAGKALNEVVRQQTGEGIVPKFRQAIGTTPRTGVASPQRAQPYVTPQIRPLTQTQRTEMRRQQNLNPVQKEFERRQKLAAGRFNPTKGEFGLTEWLLGR